MELHETMLGGCFEIRPRVLTDDRGTFVKTFQRDLFAKWGLAAEFAEQFYSVSRQGVLRGLHFQVPPAEHAKLVTCTAGAILDAVVDLRMGSPTFGRHVLAELTAQRGNMMYVPAGMAHGFYTVSESATVLYNVTSAHAPALDAGIRWDSAGIAWPEARMVTSARDAAFPRLEDFASPFVYARRA